MRIPLFFFGLLLVACAPRMEWRDRSEQILGTSAECVQGPIEIRLTAVGAHYGEAVYIDAIAPRAQSWHWEATVGPPDLTRKGVVASAADNARCLSEAPSTLAGDGAPGPTLAMTATPRPVGQAIGPSVSAPFLQEMPMPQGAGTWRYPAASWVSTGIAGPWWIGPDDPAQPPPLSAGTPIRILLWATTPNDMRDARLVIRHAVRVPSVSEERWVKYVAKRNAEARRDEELRIAKARERQRYCNAHPQSEDCWGPGGLPAYKLRLVTEAEQARRAPPPSYGPPEPPPVTPPPPPAPLRERRPPRPESPGVEWVAGYWSWTSGKYAWVAGFWRVPPTPVEAVAQVAPAAPAPVAPASIAPASIAPPPPRPEVPPPPPAAQAEWSAGHWRWNGRVHVWVNGAWFLPLLLGR